MVTKAGYGSNGGLDRRKLRGRGIGGVGWATGVPSRCCAWVQRSLLATYCVRAPTTACWYGYSRSPFATAFSLLITMYLPPLFPTLLRTTGAGFCTTSADCCRLGRCFSALRQGGATAWRSASGLYLAAAAVAWFLPEAAKRSAIKKGYRLKYKQFSPARGLINLIRFTGARPASALPRPFRDALLDASRPPWEVLAMIERCGIAPCACCSGRPLRPAPAHRRGSTCWPRRSIGTGRSREATVGQGPWRVHDELDVGRERPEHHAPGTPNRCGCFSS